MDKEIIKKIKQLSKKFSLSYNIIHNQIIIKSKFDDWILAIYDKSMVLNHVNKRNNPKQKIQTHIHRKYKHNNITHALKTIQEHDNYMLTSKYTSKHTNIVDKLLNKEVVKC